MPHGCLTASKMSAPHHEQEAADADPLAIGLLLLQRARRSPDASTSLMSTARLRGRARPLISESGVVAKRNRGALYSRGGSEMNALQTISLD